MPAATPTIAAVLEPFERSRVDAAGSGCFSLVHRESVRDALRLVRERPVDAVLVSLRRCAGEAPALLEQFARSFPSVPTVALLTERAPGDSEALLRLGATGVRQVVDATDAAGWRRLREVLGARPTEPTQAIMVPIMTALGPIPNGSRRFWEELIRTAPETTTVRRLADALAITPSTFVSRFVRSGLPSPKDHLVAVRLCHAAKLFDDLHNRDPKLHQSPPVTSTIVKEHFSELPTAHFSKQMDIIRWLYGYGIKVFQLDQFSRTPLMCLPNTEEWASFEGEMIAREIMKEFAPIEVALLRSHYGMNIAPETYIDSIVTWRRAELAIRRKAFDVRNMRADPTTFERHFDLFAKARLKAAGQ